MDNLLRKEPIIAPRDDIPLLKDRINVSWDKLSRIIERVPVVQSAPIAVAPRIDEQRLIAEVIQRITPTICEQVNAQLDDVLSVALNNSYQRMRNDLSGQLNALITEVVREETQKIVREQKLG